MKVVMADDSDVIRERLQEMLCSYHQLEIVAILKNGTDALNALRMLKPDLAILDVRMPGLSGLEVLKAIRKENKWTKIILLTMYANNYYRQLALQEGADYFLSKVEDFEKLPLLVEELLLNETMNEKLMSRQTKIQKMKEKIKNTKKKNHPTEAEIL